MPCQCVVALPTVAGSVDRLRLSHPCPGGVSTQWQVAPLTTLQLPGQLLGGDALHVLQLVAGELHRGVVVPGEETALQGEGTRNHPELGQFH